MRAPSIAAATAALASMLFAALAPNASAQAPPPAFVAHATVTVENQSPVPQIVAGTGVPPFALPPYRQAALAMSAPVPPGPLPGSPAPVRFLYSVGQAPGPECRGSIDMSIVVRGTAASNSEATHCLAHSLGTGGASCSIAVSARGAACAGGLAFIAP